MSFYAFDTFTQPMSTSIYVHIPFCASRCAYCSFYSTVAGTEAKALYLQALKTEAAARATEAHNETVRSIYFGGGIDYAWYNRCCCSYDFAVFKTKIRFYTK